MEGIYLAIISVAAVLCISATVCVALYMGIDGALYGAAIAVIGTIVGYAFGVRKASE